MAVQFIDGLQTTCHNKHKPLRYGGIILPADTHLIVKLPDSRTFQRLARFMMILGLIIVLLPWIGIGSIINKECASPAADAIKPMVGSADPINLELLPLLFHDLNKEGILKLGDKGLLLSNDEEEAIHSSLFLRRSEMEFISVTDLERQSSIPNESFDFTFTQNFRAASEFIDRTLKVGGIVAVQLSGKSSFSFDKPSNYMIVYFRKLMQTNVMVMKKFEDANSISSTQRRLLGYTSEAKKAALKNLEDVLLEPPRAASRRSKTYLKRTKYLPDLLGDTLESYPRRVLIDVGLPEKEGGSGTSSFAKNYPTRNLKFDMYKIETLTKESLRNEMPDQLAEIGMSDWLKKNVNEGEFVVMKAEAEVVEEMVKSKAIRLVDELFLECRPQGNVGRKNMSKRAYWECLALYGKLRDEGVAVHQWWG